MFVIPPAMPLLPRTVACVVEEPPLLHTGEPVSEVSHVDSIASKCLHEYPAGYTNDVLTSTVCGDGCEPVQDATLAWKLHQFFEDTELLACHCSQCGAGAGGARPERAARPSSANGSNGRVGPTPAVPTPAKTRDLPPPVHGCDGVKDVDRSGGEGVRSWPGQRRYAVYGQAAGGRPACNFLTSQLCATDFADALVALGARAAVIPPLDVDSSDRGGGGAAAVTGVGTADTASGSAKASGAGSSVRTLPVITAPAAPPAAAADVVTSFTREARTVLADSLVFDSAFECGNLKRAERVFNRFCGMNDGMSRAVEAATGTSLAVHQEYDLWLREDINTRGMPAPPGGGGLP